MVIIGIRHIIQNYAFNLIKLVSLFYMENELFILFQMTNQDKTIIKVPGNKEEQGL